MAHPNSGFSHANRPMAHRAHAWPVRLLRRLKGAAFGGPREDVAAFGAQAELGSDLHARRFTGLRQTGTDPEFDSRDAAEVARLNLRRRTLAKVNARAAAKGGLTFGTSGLRKPASHHSRSGFGMGASHMKEIAAILTMVVVAGALSAGLPGVSAAPPANSPEITAEMIADVSFVPTASPTQEPTLEPTPTEEPTLEPTPTPAPTKAPTKAVAKTVTVKKFIALGDSLTAWPSSSPWPTRFDALDSHETLLRNAGVPGDTTAMMLARVDRDVFAYNPTALFIMGGTNDLGHNIPIATTVANLKAIVLKARARGIAVFVMLVPPTRWSGEVQAIDALNSQIARMASSNKTYYIDTHTPLSTSTGVIASKYTTDGVHFTSLGAQVVANAVYARVKGLGY